ncbi:MAG TPA: GIY-YIG nuclease family protein [Terriglobales bacterium]
MRQDRRYSVYILASFTGTLYIGVTSNLPRRVWQHKQHAIEGFTDAHDVTRLLYFEVYTEVVNAITREKQLKGWRRTKKIALIEKNNPRWEDLSREWYKSDSLLPTVKITQSGDRRG